MKIFEKIILTLVVLMILVRLLFHIPFTGVFLLLSISVLSLVYLFGSWYFFSGEGLAKNTAVSVVSGLVFFIALIGVLFKLMLWPFGTVLTYMGSFFGIGLFVVLLLPGFLFRKSVPEERHYYSWILKRAFGIIGICIALAFTPIKTLCILYHPDDPEYVRLFTKAYDGQSERDWEEFHAYRKSKEKAAE
ncbi:MAG: hypothetical protein ACJ75J_10640 [Cytophagaceae bacterium]